MQQPDTLIDEKPSFFRAGMIDWNIITTQQTHLKNDNRFNLGMGSVIAGGETNILLNYSTRIPFTSRNQFYQWHYVNEKNSVFKQITLGKFYPHATLPYSRW